MATCVQNSLLCNHPLVSGVQAGRIIGGPLPHTQHYSILETLSSTKAVSKVMMDVHRSDMVHLPQHQLTDMHINYHPTAEVPTVDNIPVWTVSAAKLASWWTHSKHCSLLSPPLTAPAMMLTHQSFLDNKWTHHDDDSPSVKEHILMMSLPLNNRKIEPIMMRRLPLNNRKIEPIMMRRLQLNNRTSISSLKTRGAPALLNSNYLQCSGQVLTCAK